MQLFFSSSGVFVSPVLIISIQVISGSRKPWPSMCVYLYMSMYTPIYTHQTHIHSSKRRMHMYSHHLLSFQTKQHLVLKRGLSLSKISSIHLLPFTKNLYRVGLKCQGWVYALGSFSVIYYFIFYHPKSPRSLHFNLIKLTHSYKISAGGHLKN